MKEYTIKTKQKSEADAFDLSESDIPLQVVNTVKANEVLTACDIGESGTLYMVMNHKEVVVFDPRTGLTTCTFATF